MAFSLAMFKAHMDEASALAGAISLEVPTIYTVATHGNVSGAMDAIGDQGLIDSVSRRMALNHVWGRVELQREHVTNAIQQAIGNNRLTHLGSHLAEQAAVVIRASQAIESHGLQTGGSNFLAQHSQGNDLIKKAIQASVSAVIELRNLAQTNGITIPQMSGPFR